MRKCLLLITYRRACINVNEHFGMIACTSFGRQNVENEDVSGCL